MEWSKEYETGNELVDSEHKEIFKLTKEMLSDVFTDKRERAVSSAEFLVDYTSRHFGHEEALMDESTYPETAKHKSQHRSFVRKVENLNARLKSETDISSLSIAVNETIVNWLAEHVLNSDKRLANHYKEWQRRVEAHSRKT